MADRNAGHLTSLINTPMSYSFRKQKMNSGLIYFYDKL